MDLNEREKTALETQRDNFKLQGENKFKNANFFNNWVITISIGAFGLLFTFAKDLNHPIHFQYLLLIALTSFLLCILAVGVVYVVVIKIANRTQLKINEVIQKGTFFSNEANDISSTEGPINCFKWLTWKRASYWMTPVALILFIFGLISSYAFVILNINNISSSSVIINNYVTTQAK